MKYLVAAILILIIAAVSVIAYKKKDSEGKIVFVPSSVSEARVSNLKLKQVPDIDLGILDVKKIKFPSKLESESNDNYRSNPQLEWIVDIIPPQGFYFKKDQFLAVLILENYYIFNTTTEKGSSTLFSKLAYK